MDCSPIFFPTPAREFLYIYPISSFLPQRHLRSGRKARGGKTLLHAEPPQFVDTGKARGGKTLLHAKPPSSVDYQRVSDPLHVVASLLGCKGMICVRISDESIH